MTARIVRSAQLNQGATARPSGLHLDTHGTRCPGFAVGRGYSGPRRSMRHDPLRRRAERVVTGMERDPVGLTRAISAGLRA